LIAVTLIGVTAGVCYWLKATEYQRRANAKEWQWSNERNQLDYCVKNNLHGYTVRTVPSGRDWPKERRISVLDGDEVASTFYGQDNTVFVQIQDVFYVADFSSDGRHQIVAYDLKARKELWVCLLRGTQSDVYTPSSGVWMPPDAFNLEVDGGAILVFGRTRDHRYIEYVDPRSGKTIGYKQLPP
jgi:hypothetical protein